MGEKTYLKWYNKVGYGSGDIAGNVVYAFLTSFVMIYLTDTIGLASGIIGTLIAVSKIFDGFTDIIAVFLFDEPDFRREKDKFSPRKSNPAGFPIQAPASDIKRPNEVLPDTRPPRTRFDPATFPASGYAFPHRTGA